MGLFGNNQNSGQSLLPTGLGGAVSPEQQALFAQAAQDSGLTQMGMNMIDQATGGQGMNNKDQVTLLYQLMAQHPNQVALFFLHYPDFMKEFAALIALVVKKELYAFFNTDMIPQIRVDPSKGAEYGYASLTDENIETQVAKVVPLQQLQMEVNQADMNAMQLMNGQQQQMMMGQMQQQQMMQQQQQMMMQQQQMPQRGFGAAAGGFVANVGRSFLGLPPAKQQPMMNTGYQQTYQ